MVRRRRDIALPLTFRGRDAVAAGALTPDELRGPSVRRLFTGVYTGADVPVTHALRVEAVGLLLPPEAMVTGASLATVGGVEMLGPDDDVEVVVPESAYRTKVRGVVQRRVVVPLRPAATHLGPTSMADPLRMGFDLAVGRSLPDAVARLDAVAHAQLLDLDAFRADLRARQERGIAGVRLAAEHADARSESPPESRLRLLLVRAGVGVLPQHVVRTDGGAFVARVDLWVEGVRVAVEYDGAWHGRPEQLAKDRHRLNRLLGLGWEVVHVTAEMMKDPAAVVALVRAAVARARRRGR